MQLLNPTTKYIKRASSEKWLKKSSEISVIEST